MNSAVPSKEKGMEANHSMTTGVKEFKMTTDMKNATSNLRDVKNEAKTSFSSSVTLSNNMVFGTTSFVENTELSNVKTSSIILPSSVASSVINSQIGSITSAETNSMASTTMESPIPGILNHYYTNKVQVPKV